MRRAFILPAGHESVSGGNRYNRDLLEVASGWLEPWPSGSLARCDARTVIVDSLDLEALADLSPRPDQLRILLAHHLPSLEPDLVESAPVRSAEATALRRADAFIATGRFARSHLESFGIATECIALLPPRIRVPRAPLRDRRGPLELLMVNNLVRRKGVLAFFEHLEEGARRLDLVGKLKLLVIGRADIEPEYAERCFRVWEREPLRDLVGVLGARSFADTRSWYGRVHGFVSASRMETYGMALAEARAAGLPIIAVDGGNCSEHVHHDHTGWLCDSPERAAEEAMSWALDESRWQRYRRQANRDVELADCFEDAVGDLRARIEHWEARSP